MNDDTIQALIDRGTALTDDEGAALQEHMRGLDGMKRIKLWERLCQRGMQALDLAKSVHKHCAALILDIFQVPMGATGVGVSPNIPAWAKNDED